MSTTEIRSPLDALLDSDITLPPLPAVGVRLLRISRQPLDHIDVHQLAGLIDTDPALALRILKLANSSFYNPINEVTSLGQALMMIGPQQAVQTLCYLVLSKTAPRFQKLDHFCLDEFWAHSWACAMAARILCHPDNGFHYLPGELYLAGLLHGVGKLALAQKLPHEFDECLFRSRQTGTPLYIVERQILGYSDAELSERLLEGWSIPEGVRGVIGNYEYPGAAPAPLRDRAALLQFALIMTNQSGIGSGGTIGETDLEKSRLVQEGTSRLANPDIRERVVAEALNSLRKRAVSVVGSRVTLGNGDAEDGVPAVAPRTPVTVKRERAARSIRKKQRSRGGFLGRARKAFSSLFK